MRSGSESLSMVDVEADDGKVSQNVELDADSDMLVVVQRAILSKMVVIRKGKRRAVTPIGHHGCGQFQIKRHSGTSYALFKIPTQVSAQHCVISEDTQVQHELTARGL